MSIFSELYRKLPNIPYSLGDVNETIKDITIRFKLKNDLKYTNDFFDAYYIEQFERPDQIALKYYNDTNLSWAVLYFNNIYNIYNELPLSKADLEEYMLIKYRAEIKKQEVLNAAQKAIDFERVQVLRSEIQELQKKLKGYKSIIDNESTIQSLIHQIDGLKFAIQTAKSADYIKYLAAIDAFNAEKARLREIALRQKEHFVDLFSLYDVDYERIQTIPEMSEMIQGLTQAISSHKKAKSNFELMMLNTTATAFNDFGVMSFEDYQSLSTEVATVKTYLEANLENYGIEAGSTFELSVRDMALPSYTEFDYSGLRDVPRYNKIVEDNNNFVKVTSIKSRVVTILEEMAKSLSTFVALNYEYDTSMISLSKLLVGRLSSSNYNITDLVDRITTEANGRSSILNQIASINSLNNMIKSFTLGIVKLTDWVTEFNRVNYSVLMAPEFKDLKSKLDTTVYNLERDERALNDVEGIYNDNIQYRDSVLNDSTKRDAYTGYIDSLNELVRVNALDYKKSPIYNTTYENITASIEKLNHELESVLTTLRSYGWTERVFVDLDKLRQDIQGREGEIFFLTERKKYPSFLDVAKVYLDKSGHVIYLDPDNQQEIDRLIDSRTVRAISYRDYEHIQNDKKRTIYLLKPQFIPALMDVLKQQVKKMEASTQ